MIHENIDVSNPIVSLKRRVNLGSGLALIILISHHTIARIRLDRSAGVTTEHPVPKSLTTIRTDRNLPLIVIMSHLPVTTRPHLAGVTLGRKDHQEVWKG